MIPGLDWISNKQAITEQYDDALWERQVAMEEVVSAYE